MNGAGIFTATIITLVCGVLLGTINGILIAVAKVPALIATLGTQYIYGSLALYLTGGIPISGFPDSFKMLSLENLPADAKSDIICSNSSNSTCLYSHIQDEVWKTCIFDGNKF